MEAILEHIDQMNNHSKEALTQASQVATEQYQSLLKDFSGMRKTHPTYKQTVQLLAKYAQAANEAKDRCIITSTKVVYIDKQFFSAVVNSVHDMSFIKISTTELYKAYKHFHATAVATFGQFARGKLLHCSTFGKKTCQVFEDTYTTNVLHGCRIFTFDVELMKARLIKNKSFDPEAYLPEPLDLKA